MYADNAESEVTMPKTLEIMGYYRIEESKYMKPRNAKICPLKRNKYWYDRFCGRHECALWNEEKHKCGMIVKSV
jgi:hypothetical protein